MPRIPRPPLLVASAVLLAGACAAPPMPPPTPRASIAPQTEPRCEAAPRPEGQPAVRYDCAGQDKGSRAARFSVELPVGWEIGEHEGRDVLLMATRGWSVLVVQAGDQLPDPVTAADSADYWGVAAELMLERAPTAAEVDAVRRQAVDAAGLRRLLTRAQQADSVLLRLAGHLTAEREGTAVVSHERALRTWAGGPAGFLYEVTDREHGRFHSMGYVTVRDGVFYGLVFTAREDEFEANRARWERAAASVVIHPPRP